MFRKLTVFAVFFIAVFSARAATSGADFQTATQLLTAARNGDITTVEALVNSGVDINYIDSTGLSVVCTAIMNNDMKAAQILQVYGADASDCDNQIRRYRNKLPDEDSGGLFSGLSNAQNIALAAGGAALVIGGVYLVGDGLFGTDSGGGGSDNPNDDDDDDDDDDPTDPASALVTMAYGPAQWDFVGNQPNTTFDLTAGMNMYSSGSNQIDWTMMKNNSQIQNYLTLTSGYAAFARGYFGQVIPRTASNTPAGQSTGPEAWTTPIPVALISANGVNKTGTAAEHLCLTGGGTGCPTIDPPPRYKNDDEDDGHEIAEDIELYDYSGAGSAFDTSATDYDSLLAKIIIGGTAVGDTRGTADFIGFMPNGQMLLYRTGGGFLYETDLGAVVYPSAGFITIEGSDYEIAEIIDSKGHYHAGGTEYAISNGNLFELVAQPYRNFEAMNNAISRSVVIANASIPEVMKTSDVSKIGTIIGSSSKSQTYTNLVDLYYYNDTNFALSFNVFAGGTNSPIIVFSSGEYQVGLGAGMSTDTLTATFENAAPIVYTTLNRHFATAVAVELGGGTSSLTSAASSPSFGGTRKYALSSYQDADENTFAARACGVAGVGYDGIDPWCFAAPGKTGEQAVSTLAGVAGTLKGAFNYMTTEQIYYLMALTADGKYYNVADLKNRYSLPADWVLPDMTDDEWKTLFKQAFGYGVVNLERATRPSEKLYFYSDISLDTGYWSATPSTNRAALTLSPVYGARGSITLPMFDYVVSADGTESMPRAFQTELSFGGEPYGLNLANLLDEVDLDSGQSAVDSQINFKLTQNNEIKNLEIKSDNFGFSYRERKVDETFRTSNPILGLAGNLATFSSKLGRFNFGLFTGNITDETLLGYDPMLTNDFTPAKLGGVYGADVSSEFSIFDSKISIGTGFMKEDNTVLGAYSEGLFDMGGGQTVYGETKLKLGAFTAKYTIARTNTDPKFGFISDVSDLYSDAYSIGANFGSWEFNISQPLAITNGTLDYVQTDFEITSANELITNSYIETINLAPENRETRFSLLYQPKIFEKTKLAFGFIERVNPDNRSGHEEIFLLKAKTIW